MKYLLPKDIKDNLIIIKINESYYEGISAEALYEYTRGIWYRNLKSVRNDDYALSVVNGIVIEVYKIDRWMPATEAIFRLRTINPQKAAKRIAFEGRIADDLVRNRYLGKSVKLLYERSATNPAVSFSKYSN